MTSLSYILFHRLTNISDCCALLRNHTDMQVAVQPLQVEYVREPYPFTQFILSVELHNDAEQHHMEVICNGFLFYAPISSQGHRRQRANAKLQQHLTRLRNVRPELPQDLCFEAAQVEHRS